MTPDQMTHALEPLRVVDAKALDEIANAMKKSKSKQKRAVGAFLSRINRYRLGSTTETGRSGHTPIESNTGLTDLPG